MSRGLLLPVLVLLACDKEPEGPAEAPYSDCDPLDAGLCALPWPSTFYMEEDATTASGWRVNLRPNSLPMNRDGVQLKPDSWNQKDGFSTLGPFMFYFRDVDPALLISHQDIGAYEADDARVALLDAETGERVPIFVEVDGTAEYTREQLILGRPVVPLKHGHRYVVVVRGLKTLDGAEVEVSESFKQHRDGATATSWDVEGRRERYESDIFPVAEKAGFARADLQLAWDFVTISRESSLGGAEWMRDDAAERVGAEGPAYTITSVEESDCASGATIGRTLEGVMTVPLYTEFDGPGTKLTRDADGMPYYNGDATAEFTVRIPCSLLAEPRPAFVLQYGHGLLGSRGEVRTGYLSDMANRYGWVLVATDWTGMYEDDLNAITLMIANDPSDFGILPERSVQGFVHQDLLLRLARGGLVNDPNLIVDGTPLIDPDRFGYYGNSQGGILGAGYVGMSTQIERAVLGVGGMPYAVLLPRSADFDPFFLIFNAKFEDHRDIAFLIGAFQTLWDVGEGAGWARSMVTEPGEGQSPKDVLMQVGIGDAQVTTLGAHIMARAYGASLVTPQTREIWGLSEQTAPFEGSALVEWYYPDGSEEPVESVPPSKDGDTHECPRREPAAQDQLRDFLEDGVVNQYCDGVCEGVRAGFCD